MSGFAFSSQRPCLTVHTPDSAGTSAWQTRKRKCPHTCTQTSQTHQSSRCASVWLPDSVASMCGANETVRQPVTVRQPSDRGPTPVSYSRAVFLINDEHSLMRPTTQRGLLQRCWEGGYFAACQVFTEAFGSKPDTYCLATLTVFMEVKAKAVKCFWKGRQHQSCYR